MLKLIKICQEVRAIDRKTVIPTFSAVFSVNILLFAVKLYIGLSSNSISIYSDGINNLFDGLSCVAAAVCFYFVSKSKGSFAKFLSYRMEQLLSAALSFMIFAVGLIFLYNSAERLMYPTPVWFTVNYFWMLSATTAVKLLMFVALKKKASELGSEVIKVMSFDSLTDFFITAVTVLTLFISQKGGYSFDACGGIGISLLVIISAVKSIKKSILSLLNLPEKEKRIKIEQLISQSITNGAFETDFAFAGEERIYLKTNYELDEEGLEALKEKVYNETGINLYVIK